MLVKRGFGERTQAKVNEFASRHNVPLLDVIKSGESEVCSIFKRFGLGHLIPEKQPIRYRDLPNEGGIAFSCFRTRRPSWSWMSPA